MIVGIHYDQIGNMSTFSQKYEKILEYNDIDVTRFDCNDSDFWEKVKNIDFFIFRWPQWDTMKNMAQSILPVIERELNIKTFPNQNTCWHYDDKIKQYYLLKSNNFPITKTWIFWDKENAYEFCKSANYPILFKLTSGAGSENVVLVKNKKQGFKIVCKMFGSGIKSLRIPIMNNLYFKEFNILNTYKFILSNKLRKLLNKKYSVFPFWKVQKDYVLFQKFLPNNNYDTRVTVIGDRCFALQRRNRKNDFRASASGKLNYDPNNIDMKFIKIAFEISKKYQFQSMAYDFLYDEEKNPSLSEISYTFPGGHFLYDCPGYWDSELKWHEGHYFPQYCQLQDLLERPDLLQPDFDE